jgi:O-antigen/teichoic acid export membrane protein
VFDAAFNSLGTFAVGLTAARIFEPSLLGVYAVFFAAHLMGLVVPMHLVFLPAEIRAVAREPERRLSILRRSALFGLAPSVMTGFAVLLSIAVTADQASGSQLLALALTTSVATVLVPLQAHLRRMLHLAQASWRATAVSAVQFAGAIVAVAGLLLSGVPDAWVPFGALTLATGGSIVTGFVLAAPGRDLPDDRIRMMDLMTTGRWLLVSGLVPTVAGFVAATLINRLAGPEQLGYAEAARLAAQPILVLGLGLNAVLGPRAMEAAHRRDRVAARRIERIFLAVLAVAAAGYLLVAGGPWPWNPLYYLIPPGYELAWLAALMIVSNAATGSVLPFQRELLGGRLEEKLAGIEIMGSIATITVALSSAVTGAFARPFSLLAQNAARAAGYRRALRHLDWIDPEGTGHGGDPPARPDRG